MGDRDFRRMFAFAAGGIVLVLAFAISVSLFVLSAGFYGGDCDDTGYRDLQLASSAAAALGCLLAIAGVVLRWRRARGRWLLPLALAFGIPAELFTIAIIGCGG